MPYPLRDPRRFLVGAEPSCHRDKLVYRVAAGPDLAAAVEEEEASVGCSGGGVGPPAGTPLVVKFIDHSLIDSVAVRH